MTEFQNKSFSVYPGERGGEQYRDNWDRVFGKCPKCGNTGCGWFEPQGRCSEKDRTAKAVATLDP